MQTNFAEPRKGGWRDCPAEGKEVVCRASDAKFSGTGEVDGIELQLQVISLTAQLVINECELIV